MDDLLSAAKELLEDFDLYGAPVQLQTIAKLRRAVVAAQLAVDAAYACEDCGSVDPQVHLSHCPVANRKPWR
jgi:lipopolysaccharide biosynthesis regulator YciM